MQSAQLESVTDLILGYLESKSLVKTQDALRVELALLQEATIDKGDLVPTANVYVSELERRLGIGTPREQPTQTSTPVVDSTPSSVMAAMTALTEKLGPAEEWRADNRASALPTPPGGMPLYTFHKHESVHDEQILRDCYGSISRARVVSSSMTLLPWRMRMRHA